MNERRNIAPIARAVCAALGATFKHDDGNDWYASGTMPDGVKLGFHLGYGRSARLETSVSLPGQITYRDVEENGKDLTSRIACDPERDPAAIARDITRRLLPDARTLYARAVELARQREEYAAGTEKTLATLAKRLKCERRRNSELYPGGVILRVNGPDYVSIERISCTAETAARIVELLMAEKAGE